MIKEWKLNENYQLCEWIFTNEAYENEEEKKKQQIVASWR